MAQRHNGATAQRRHNGATAQWHNGTSDSIFFLCPVPCALCLSLQISVSNKDLHFIFFVYKN
jgi:hypothetical protein